MIETLIKALIVIELQSEYRRAVRLKFKKTAASYDDELAYFKNIFNTRNIF